MGAGKAESQKSEWSRKSELEPEKQKLGVRMEQKAGRQNLELIPNRNLRASKDCEFRLFRDGLDETGATNVLLGVVLLGVLCSIGGLR